ncbi:hypothetical protein IE53DRAFT_322024, partial [Violaceomyces palustris]
MLQVLVSALVSIGCQSVRVQAYGMKAALASFSDPAQHQPHPLQVANVYDIACTYPTEAVTLLAPASRGGSSSRGKPARRGGSALKLYPSGLRVGKGYGGVEHKAAARPDGITHFKAYSKLTHVLKAVSQGAGLAGQPMRMVNCRKRLTTLRVWKERVLPCPQSDMEGIRLEVTVRAPTLRHAIHVAHSSRLLDASYLLSQEAGNWQLSMLNTSKAALLKDL